MWFSLKSEDLIVTKYLWSAITVGVIVLIVKYNWSRRKLYRISAELPGPPAIPLLGSAHLVWGKDLKGISDFVLDYWYKYYYGTKSPLRVWLGPVLSIIPTTPEDMQIVMNAHESFDKPFTYNSIKPIVRSSLLTIPYAEWKPQRKVFSPYYSKKMCESYIKVFNNKCETLMGYLENKTIWPEPEIQTLMFSYAMDCIVETMTRSNALNYDDFSYFKNEVDRLGEMCFIRLPKFWLLNEFVYSFTDMSKELDRSMKIMEDKIHQKIINQRQAKGAVKKRVKNDDDDDDGREYECLLDYTLAGEHEIPVQEVKDNLTFFFASSETSGTSIYNILMMLAIHPKVQAKVVEELESIFGDSCRPVEPADVQKMMYLEMVIKETLRLCVQVFNTGRVCYKDLKLTTCTVPAGAMFSISPFIIHFNEYIWPNPKKFDPDRFLPENSISRHKYSYLPFSAGPRNCIGYKFTLVMLKTMLANFLRVYSVNSEAKLSDITYKISIFAKYKCDHPIVLTRRNCFNNND